ncbi:VOC family protein [Stakelama tenebrarum]|uniref:VOC family protein n=1 Tax=Stakelama tenebrarum TaxID=2711215 RepID=A0A6G6Y2L7_9SPHN|nr:VOC family protein [Sphingosinithalassobacter tenebrarum]QIG79194.1 VOC family protein [Sphingosinithalassobacter tenebrarum]
MSDDQGAFIWYELMTPDLTGARAFYQEVMGWAVPEQGHPPVDYREIAAPDGEMVGGMLPLSPEMLSGGAKPGWYGYVCVDDVDVEIAELKAAGGTVFMDQTMPDVGRIAMVADPQGVPLYLMKPIPPADRPDAKSTAFAPDRVGHIAWNELVTPDPAAAKSWYLERFGWTVSGAMPMGPSGDYEFLARGDAAIGAMMRTPEAGISRWNFYWNVGAIDAAKDRLEAAGGAVRNGPHEVPGGDFVIEARDPQGVDFGMVGKRH